MGRTSNVASVVGIVRVVSISIGLAGSYEPLRVTAAVSLDAIVFSSSIDVVVCCLLAVDEAIAEGISVADVGCFRILMVSISIVVRVPRIHDMAFMGFARLVSVVGVQEARLPIAVAVVAQI